MYNHANYGKTNVPMHGCTLSNDITLLVGYGIIRTYIYTHTHMHTVYSCTELTCLSMDAMDVIQLYMNTGSTNVKVPYVPPTR